MFAIRLTAAIALTAMTIPSSVAVAVPDVSNKVVLANLDRYDAVLKVGSIQREIKPKKASVLSPREYPVTIQYWSGNTKTSWRTQSIDKAGIYGFNFKRGYWELTELKKGTTTRSSPPPRRTVIQQRSNQSVVQQQNNRTTIQQRIVRQPVRRLPINADHNRWSPLARVAYGAGKIYQFVRDEQDRDLLRHLLVRAREDEDFDRLDDWLRDAKIPELYKHELRDIFDDWRDLDEKDWDEIDTADEKDWDLAKDDLGDLISDDDWENIDTDFAEIDTDDYWKDDVDVDLDDIDFADNLDIDGDLDLGDDLDLDEDFDVGDLEIDTDHYDLGEFDDFGGYDGAFDVDSSDLGGADIDDGFLGADDAGDFDGGYLGDDDFGDFGGFDDLISDNWDEIGSFVGCVPTHRRD